MTTTTTTRFASITKHDNNIIHFVLVGNPSVSTFTSDFLTPLNALVSNQKRFSLMIDTQHIDKISMKVAYAMIKWMRANRSAMKTYLRATGVLITNQAVKSIMEFVISMQPPASPLQICETMMDAWNFVSNYVE